jgi:hypothetical protein
VLPRLAQRRGVKPTLQVTSRDYFVVCGWPLLSAWSGGVFIWYGVYGSPTILVLEGVDRIHIHGQ